MVSEDVQYICVVRMGTGSGSGRYGAKLVGS